MAIDDVFKRLGEYQRAGEQALAVQFRDLQSARDWRQHHGGWIFDGKARDGRLLVAWFHPEIPPSGIFHHPLTKGADGRLI